MNQYEAVDLEADCARRLYSSLRFILVLDKVHCSLVQEAVYMPTANRLIEVKSC